MAGDYPDYSPSYLVRYGNFNQYAFSKLAVANSTKELCSIQGKGTIYGGYLKVGKTTTAQYDQPRIEIDGVLLSSLSFYALDFLNIDNPYAYPFFLGKYDDTNFIYVVHIAPGITFDNKLRLLYTEDYGDTPLVLGFLNYGVHK